MKDSLTTIKWSSLFFFSFSCFSITIPVLVWCFLLYHNRTQWAAVKFGLKYYFLPTKCTWKCHLQNLSHSVLTSIYSVGKQLQTGVLDISIINGLEQDRSISSALAEILQSCTKFTRLICQTRPHICLILQTGSFLASSIFYLLNSLRENIHFIFYLFCTERWSR